MAEGGEDTLQEPVDESQQPFDPPLDQINLPDLKEAFYLDADHIREVQDKNGEVETLGKGSFGRVTKVYWNELPCAAKESADDFKLLSDENRRRATKGFFVESLQLAARLRHPNIVQYIGLWRKPNGKDIIIMELLPRNSLTRFLTDSRTRITSIPLHVKRRVLADVCCAMIYLHNLRPCVLHRDLTSNNILLTNDFRAKVTDFGQARFYADADQDKLTKQPGTRDFMPPEALLPEPKYGKPLDRFSFGCVTLHMLTHNWPKPNVVASKKPRTPWDNRKHLLPHLSSEQRDRFIKPIVIPCLDIKPEKRPTFKDIYRILTTSGDVFTDDECKRMLDRDIDPASMQNKLPEGGTSSKNISEMDEQLKRESSEWQSEITALKLEVATGKEHAKIQVAQLEETQSSMAATTSQLEQAAAARNEMEKELQHLREKCDHLEQEHQETLAKKVEELNSMKRESEREIQALKETHATLIAAKEKSLTKKSQDVVRLQDKLAEAQRKELDLNDQLRLYRNQLEATKVALQVEKDKLHSKEESVCQKEEEVKKLKGDLQSERDKVQTLEEAALQKERELDQCKDSKAAMEKDLVRARKMAKDLLDERVVVNVESEQQMENLNERLVEFKQQAVLSEERLKQVQGLEGEHLDLKVQLKTLTTTLEDFQKVLTDEQKSRKSLDASIKALTAEIDQLRTELKERDNEVSSLAAANKHLQRKVDAADANSGEMKAKITQLRTELKERDNKVSSLAAANGGLQRKVNAADADITEMKAKSTSLKEQVKALSNDKKSLKQTLNATEAALQKHKNDYKDCQEKLREAEQQVALFQGKRQQLEVLESVPVELKSRLSDLMMDAPLSMTPSVSGGKDGSSAVALAQEAAHKVQQLERERDSLKAERHMYQMKWLAAEDMLEAVKSEKQSLENNLELTRQAFQSTKVHLLVTEQSLREEYKKKFSEAYEVMKSLQQEQEEGGAQHPPDRIKLDALMDICRYYKDERDKEIERAAAEKHCILASKKEADERAEAMACKIAALKECIEVRDGEIKRIKAQLVPHKMEAAPVPLPSDVVDVTADEALLQQLCYMATGIKKLLVSADGGRFTLGSGDASLEFPPGTVEKETSVRYAIILHGPFVFPAGYKPGSVIIYLNMEGATLLKPVILYLSHWCVKEKGEDEDTLKFVSASHTLEAEHQAYVFEEEDDADFTRTNVGVLSIRDPHCLFCVKTKREKIAMYSAIAFSRYIPSEETLLFRIQLMCDSLEWNEKLTKSLQQKNWEKTSDGDVVTRFQYADGQHQITASPKEMSGPGWEAAIYGQQGVMDQMFLGPLRKSKDEVDQEIISGRFPPCILYQIIYNSPEEKRIRPALLKVDLNGADVPLVFNCRIKEEMYPTSPVSPAFFSSATSPRTPGRMAASYGPSPATSGHILSAEGHPEISKPADVIEALSPQLDSEWRAFGSRLRVETSIMDSIEKNKANVGERMLQLVEKWLGEEDQTADLPRTWETVVQVVKGMGKVPLAKQLAEKHGVQLSGR